jgi:hypothetical protein
LPLPFVDTAKRVQGEAWPLPLPLPLPGHSWPRDAITPRTGIGLRTPARFAPGEGSVLRSPSRDMEGHGTTRKDEEGRGRGWMVIAGHRRMKEEG